MAADARTRIGAAGLASLAIFLAFAAVTLASAVTRPIANWDMLAYQAAVLDRGGTMSSADLHTRTYTIVRDRVGPESYRELTTGDRFRQRWAEDPDAFRSLLPMYAVKGGYVILLRAMSAFAPDAIGPARAVSLASVAAMLAAILVVFWRLGALPWLALVVPVLAAMRFADLASMTAPDPLASALLVVAGAILATGGGVRLGPAPVALIAFAITMRPDMLVIAAGLPLALVVAAGVVAWRDGRRPIAALSTIGPWPWAGVILGVGAYLLAKWGIQHPGWWPHFNFSILRQEETMAGFAPAFSWSAYGQGLLRGILRSLRDEIWPWLMTAMLVAGALVVPWRRVSAQALALILVAAGAVAGRMIVFPLPDSRLAVVPIVLLVFAAARCIRDDRDGLRA
jgi:hypothetical protein